jgi:muramoyltetrapeptide carboxypeptidase LdcA involved in peptidoglycan recycling
MAAAGALQSAQALLFGRPYRTPSDFDAYDAAILGACRELGLESLSLVTQTDFGHTDPMFVIPSGIEAEVDCDNRQLRLLSGAVR